MTGESNTDAEVPDVPHAPDASGGRGATRPWRSRSGRRKRSGLGIQSKLLIMLLCVSIGSGVVAGYAGYLSGTASLKQAAFERLTELRESKARQITDYFTQIQNSLVVYTRGTTAIDALKDFTTGFDALEPSSISPANTAKLTSLYTQTFVPELERRSGTTSNPDVFMPTDPAQRYLQAHYTDPKLDYDKALKVDDAGDGSAWSAANAKYQDYFREIINRFGYEDAMLIDPAGKVVYSAYKGVDLGTDLKTGPYKGTSLASGFTAAMNSNAVDYVGLTDFQRYQPSLDVPTMWVFSPVGQGGEVDGVMALQVPLDGINNVMTGGEDWKKDGLGDTGEVYLVGADHLMRSTSRELIQHPKQYEKDAIAAGTAPDVVKRAVQVKGTVLLQPSTSQSATNALHGKSGTAIAPGYLGAENLTAYAPLNIAGLHWGIVARIDSSEAFAPVADFTRNLILVIVALIVIVSLLSLALAQVFTRPVRGLVAAVRRVAGGDLTVEVPEGGRDEFGDLGNAFNDMSRSLRVKQQLIDEQRTENDKLLHTLMPEPVAQRYRDGEETIAEVHQDVSVLFADLVGFDDFSVDLDSDKEMALLNGIVRSFDEAAERMGVETVRTLREGYLASCGLVVPRVDNVRRTVDFAIELRTIIERFNATQGASLSLRVGVDTGTVSSGLVGRTSLAYDLWGDAVSIANRVQAVAGRPGIFVSQRVRDRLQDIVTFAQAGTIETSDGVQAVWQVQ